MPYLPLPAGHAPGWSDALKNAVTAFYAAVRTEGYRKGSVPYATFADGVLGNRFVDACLISARENRWAEL